MSKKRQYNSYRQEFKEEAVALTELTRTPLWESGIPTDIPTFIADVKGFICISSDEL